MYQLVVRWSLPLSICLLCFGNAQVFAKKGLSSQKIRIANPLLGIWESPCQYLGGNEYRKEVLEFKGPKKIRNKDKLHGIVWRRFINFQDAACSSPWFRVSNKYQYTIKKASSLENGTNYDLKFVNTKVISYVEEATKALQAICHRRKKKHHNLKTNKEREFKKMQCGEFVKYPGKRMKYYDIIRLENNQLSLGNNSEVTDHADRPTEYASYYFQKQ